MLHRLFPILFISFCSFTSLFLPMCHATSKSSPATSSNVSFDFEKEIADISNPTYEEYKKIESYLSQITGKGLPFTKSQRGIKILNHLQLVGEDGQMPISEIVYLNNQPENRHNCIVLYASYNSPYPDGIYHFIERLREIGFDGHIIYHIGGFPGVNKGLLKLVTIPYAFKYCALQDAIDRGYQNVLWVDPMLVPVKRLDPIFTILETRGFFLTKIKETLGNCLNAGVMTEDHLSDVNMSFRQGSHMHQCVGAIFGINIFSNEGKAFFSKFRQFTTDSRINFRIHSCMCEELALSAAAYTTGSIKAYPLLLMIEGDNRFFNWSSQRPSYRTHNCFLTHIEEKNSDPLE